MKGYRLPRTPTSALGANTLTDVGNASNDRELDPALFTATVTSLAHSFGDNTRRKIFLFLRENPGATASELADHCHVHPNVVRHHLEKLMEGGHVTFDSVHKTTAGRPAKGYRVCDASVSVESSLRRDALLVAMLEMALERLGPEAAEVLAHDVGLDYGRSIAVAGTGAEAPTVRAAMTSIAGVLTAHGFAARVEEADHGHSVVSDNCPFGAAAQTHPVLCAVDRGLIAGMLEGMGAPRTNVTLTSKARGDNDCRVTA